LKRDATAAQSLCFAAAVAKRRATAAREPVRNLRRRGAPDLLPGIDSSSTLSLNRRRSPCQAPTGTRADHVKGYTPALNERRPEPAVFTPRAVQRPFTAGCPCSHNADAGLLVGQVGRLARFRRQRQTHRRTLRRRRRAPGRTFQRCFHTTPHNA
jgi:hypothetical protein